MTTSKTKEVISERETFIDECKETINDTNAKLTRWSVLNREIFDYMYSKLDNENERRHIDNLTQEQEKLFI